MGQAFDEQGHILAEAFGKTKQEVFDELQKRAKDAHEFRIRELAATSQQDDGIEHNFTYHPPQPGQPEIYEQIWSEAKVFAYLVTELCPASRERSLALTNLEQAVFWASASIARQK